VVLLIVVVWTRFGGLVSRSLGWTARLWNTLSLCRGSKSGTLWYVKGPTQVLLSSTQILLRSAKACSGLLQLKHQLLRFENENSSSSSWDWDVDLSVLTPEYLITSALPYSRDPSPFGSCHSLSAQLWLTLLVPGSTSAHEVQLRPSSGWLTLFKPGSTSAQVCCVWYHILLKSNG
jgi:hypothetical protein